MPAFTGGTPLLLPAPGAEKGVGATVLAGTAPPPAPAAPARSLPSGDISLNFPGADPRAVAQAVLGEILKLPYRVVPGAVAPVSLVTPHPVPRSAVFALLEDALRASNLAVANIDGVFVIEPVAAAQGAGSVVSNPGAPGFATEVIRLRFVNAEEMRRLLDPLLPGVVTSTDPAANSLTVSGTTGQRENVRDLLRQFDVDWLRAMSFGLFVPQHTDARLIVPELEKLLNAPGAPTRDLVRLIAMDRLNGILAISGQRQYLEDVRRFVEVLDREGQSNEPRLFVYRVQNGRSRDLVKVLNAAFGRSSGNDEPGGIGPGGSADVRTSAIGNGAASPAAPQGSASVPSGSPLQPGAGLPDRNGGTPAAANDQGGAPTDLANLIHATISSNDTNNSIVVFGTPRDYAIIEDALRKLDVLPQQVLIEAAITEVTLNDDLRYGVQWNFDTGLNNFALSEGTTAAPSRQFPGFSYFYGGSSITATLNALEERTKVNVISAPKLLVLNNETATLQVGDEVPVATQSAVGITTANAPIVNSIEYRDTGVILRITPRVNSGGLVLLDISQEVSAVSSATTSTTTTNNSPTISTRRIATSISAQDGQVVALGGLIRDTRTQGRTGLPYLSRIPVLGGLLFGRTEDTDNRTELLILLKPHVLRTIEDTSAVTDELRAKIRTVAPIRLNKLP